MQSVKDDFDKSCQECYEKYKDSRLGRKDYGGLFLGKGTLGNIIRSLNSALPKGVQISEKKLDGECEFATSTCIFLSSLVS